jgi:hypothetical protein
MGGRLGKIFASGAPICSLGWRCSDICYYGNEGVEFLSGEDTDAIYYIISKAGEIK